MFKLSLKSCLPFLIVLLVLSACKKENENPTEEAIKIGALIPLSGSGSSSGEGFNAAIALALHDINNHLRNINSVYRMEVLTKDTQTDTLVAVQKYNQLKAEGIRLIIGPYSSAEVKTLKPYADQDGILLVSPSSVSISLAIAGDNVFRLSPCDVWQAEAMTALLNDDSILVVIPVVRDDLWGNDLLEATKQNFLSKQKEVAEAVKYSPETTDFQPDVDELSARVATVLQQHDPSEVCVYMISFGEGTEILATASSDSTLGRVRWYGSSAYAENKSLLNNALAAQFAGKVGLPCPIFGYDPNARSKWEPLLGELQAELGRKTDIYSLVVYDALWLAALTYINTSGDFSIVRFKEAFTVQASNFFGATGWIRLNEAGDRAQATYDFWGMSSSVIPEWQVVATYNNTTKMLIRY